MHLLCVASLVPRKGHDTLFDALERLPHLDWQLTCVGSARSRLVVCGRIWRGAQRQPPLRGSRRDGRRTCRRGSRRGVRRADLFVLPTHYEGYGMAVAEALARGLPVVSTATGAIAELVGADAGVLVPSDDADGSRRGSCDRDDRSLAPGRTSAQRRAAGSRFACPRGTRPPHEWRKRSTRFDAQMSGFTAEWLALREPADTAARSADGRRLVVESVGRHSRRCASWTSDAAPARTCGYLSPLASDGAGVAPGGSRCGAAWRSRGRWCRCDVETRVADLRHLDASLFADRDLVTASALLDLVSEEWLRHFVQHCRRARRRSWSR